MPKIQFKVKHKRREKWNTVQAVCSSLHTLFMRRWHTQLCLGMRHAEAAVGGWDARDERSSSVLVCLVSPSVPVRFSSASVQRGELHSGGPRGDSGNGTRSRYSLKEGSHRDGSSSRKGVRVLQPVLHCSKKEWRFASHFRFAATEPFSQQTEVQDAHNQTSHDSNQVRGLFCFDRSRRRIISYLHPSHSQEFPKVCFREQSLPISGSSFRPSTLTPHFYEVCECCVSSAAATRHLHTQLHRQLVDSRSERMVAQHWDVVLAHIKALGLRLNAKKSVLSPSQRTTYQSVTHWSQGPLHLEGLCGGDFGLPRLSWRTVGG